MTLSDPDLSAPMEQSDQGPYCLPFHQTHFCIVNPNCSIIRTKMVITLCIPIFKLIGYQILSMINTIINNLYYNKQLQTHALLSRITLHKYQKH